MLDRKKTPQIKSISKINYQKPTIHTINNGIKLYTFHSNDFPIIKVDIIFKAGVEYQSEKFHAAFANSLIKEAPIGMNSDDVSEIFDYYGSVVDGFVGNKTAGLRLFVPLSFFDEVFPVFASLLVNPSIPESEFEILKNKQYQFIQNNLKVTKYLANRCLNSELFGVNNPRGYVIEPDDVFNIKLDNIRNFISKYYCSSNCYIIVSGAIGNKILLTIDKCFGSVDSKLNWNKNSYEEESMYPKIESLEEFKFIEVKDAVQSTICIGKNLGKLNDKDLIDISILNTVFGGYFGSRLMKNIREDKGYTYGIGSFIVEYSDIACLKITSDVGGDVTKNAVSEVFKELESLCKKLVPNSELDLVRSFMLGEIISAFDGVINTSEVWEKIISTDKNKDHINLQIDRIKSITPNEIKKLANKFLSNQGFHTVVAGKY